MFSGTQNSDEHLPLTDGQVRKGGGRPRLPEGERRAHRVGVSLTEAERKTIAAKAEEAGLSLAAYLRQAGLGARLSAHVNGRAYHQLSRIGVNLNQVARVANAAGRLPELKVLRAILAEVREIRGPDLTADPGRRQAEDAAMIGKVTRGASFGGLAAYLTGRAERVAWTEPRYLLGTDPKEVAREMEAAAGQSSRVEKPVYHLSISFDEADCPSREQMRAAVEEVLKELGLEEHQALLVAHVDTAHPHVHVMVNRVHPRDGGRRRRSATTTQRSSTRSGVWRRAWGMKRVAGHHARAPGHGGPGPVPLADDGGGAGGAAYGRGVVPR